MALGGSSAAGIGMLAPLMFAMLISGTMNTILMKFMVMQQVPTGPGQVAAGFEYPYFQSLLMMIGEFLCLILFYASKNQAPVKGPEAPKGIFAVACLLDWTATTLVNMAYVLIAASVIQMTRGAIVIFTCLFSVLFLGRRQHRYHIAGVMLVFLGITFVSLSTFVNPAADTTAPAVSVNRQLMGIGLCVTAQVFQAAMLVYEEKIMSQFDVPPLQVVGMEGAFGIMFGIVLLTFLNATGIESSSEALYQMGHSTPLAMAVVGSIFSIALFNYAGVTVTQKASAVSRSTIDVSRTILIWAVELAFGWNRFNVLELAGFIILAFGTLIYNRLIVLSALEPPAEAEHILNDKSKEPIEVA
ncbi:unnamed protein product [Polarella glacialis]|uniref:EamA domain-containing protein n=1 Tax=Polarella glacialis TaxID=89957 RepID=A0A813IYY7_POLGL|nr:unnamed protein product [Polarella glacialis]CAE8661819.1 unnamed protein product [Polarella glacialis]|mmetsp:Transcript_24325/g.38973  ORF Transcript_24325/g.38973 Transcript_24325/m.38973 type:complete len:357 (+) Transcript_24325:266-1336(+)|eukprot:CAMPEP_0115084498 /NCGR_PEP_ID=MMETSP0227-20121206/21302_1 /TAXON_ID=89957 /ORGANISM="Polarella glacialis, Strain CCMP 1383" /LENGTH=356 /DNA_ID=CAMNT_0002473329 /DNA_START=360 /DNA_END=1430 /DNA_ORIENTATION=+